MSVLRYLKEVAVIFWTIFMTVHSGHIQNITAKLTVARSWKRTKADGSNECFKTVFCNWAVICQDGWLFSQPQTLSQGTVLLLLEEGNMSSFRYGTPWKVEDRSFSVEVSLGFEFFTRFIFCRKDLYIQSILYGQKKGLTHQITLPSQTVKRRAERAAPLPSRELRENT